VTGLFRNRTLGMYRAFVTDPARAVVLKTAGRTIVISPSEPEAFLEELRALVPGVEIGTTTGTGTAGAVVLRASRPRGHPTSL
jgi:hypothetical protein